MLRILQRLLVVSIIIVALIIPSMSLAFDGQRKGLNLGGGIGICPASQISYYGRGDIGVSLDLSIGYSFGNQNTFLWSVKGAISHFSEAGSLAHEIDGLNWYHYFKKDTPSIYSIMGFGISIFGNSCWTSAHGAWSIVGLGYEFTRHLAINGFFLSAGPNHGDIHFESANITMSAMIY
ncbi:conserved exported hypothetical protein [Candidatus Zixiibacteriota bacterium]|nr:conserved exported hypothetical protein [candidate division Zixibacteria bacterium]